MMDKSEIIILYRQAKDKERQIKVLSDLNCVSPREIAEILDEAGELKKAGLNAKTFSSVYHAVPAAKAPQREGPKATRKRSGPVPPFDEIRAMALFNDGMDDLAISEALGVSVTRIRKWRSRMRLLHPRGRAAKNKKQSKEESMKKDGTTKKTEPHKNVSQEVVAEKETAAADKWAGYTVPLPDEVSGAPAEEQPEDTQESKPLTVNGFFALLRNLLSPVLLDAELSINGERMVGVYGYEVQMLDKRTYVDLRTREAPNASDRD